MTFRPTFSLGNYVSEQVEFPKDEQQFKNELKKTLEDYAKLINRKDTGQYEPYEIPVNQSWPGANLQERRQIYRKIVDTGALPNAGASTTAHGITGIGNNWFFTRIYGTAQEPAGAGLRPFFIPLPNSGPNYQVEIMVDTTNVNITTVANLSAFTSSYVVLEFYKA